ncbi:MAG: hypothetical protein AAGJ50_01600, partial [Pseudomonadota bacterium]
MRKLRTCLPALRGAACGAFAVLAGAGPTSNAMEDNPNFTVLGVVFVWGADGFGTSAGAPIVSDFIIDSGTGNTAATSGDADLISGDVHTVVTGELTPTADGTVSTNGVPFRIQRVQGGAFTTDPNGDGILNGDDGFNAFTIRNNSDINSPRRVLMSLLLRIVKA